MNIFYVQCFEEPVAQPVNNMVAVHSGSFYSEGLQRRLSKENYTYEKVKRLGISQVKSVGIGEQILDGWDKEVDVSGRGNSI